jgi:polyhydroxybutyrate depolymerase
LALWGALALVACGGSGSGAVDAGPDAAEVAAADVGDDLADAAEVSHDAPVEASPADVVIPTTVGGERPAALIVPTSYDPGRAWPLVMLLHGYGVDGKLQSAYLGLPARAESMGFVLVVPDGTPDSQGLRFWNASSACCNFDGVEVDDVAYLRGLVAETASFLNIDPAHVVLLGHSNGGFMAFRMACDAADVVTAIGAIAGSMGVGFECTPSRPVSVLDVHGTADADILFAGGDFQAGAPYLSADDVVQAWVGLDACPGGPEALGSPVDYDVQNAGAETTRTAWTGCADGSRVDFWRMEGSPHIPPFTPAFKDAVLLRLLGR